ncbi:unnamed protein product [Schistosoma turkestanicum]|nr:unnamed protein product [Schistosoma turkestanicum]
MNGNLSVLYSNCSIHLFDSSNGNLMNYSRSYPNSCGFTSNAYLNKSQNVKVDSQNFTQKRMSRKKKLVCPKCNSCSEDSSWCSNCGELLIGAEICSSGEPKFLLNEVSKTQTNRMNSSIVSSNISSSVPVSFRMSCENDIQLQNLVAQQHRAMLTTATDVTSLPSCAASAFSSANLNTRNSEWSNFSSSSSKHFNQLYHNEPSIPLCVPVEPSFSKYENVGLLQNVSADQQQYQFEKNNEHTNSFNSKLLYPKRNDFTESTPWNSKHINGNQNCNQLSHSLNNVPDYRTSGLIKQNKLTSDHSNFGNVYHTNNVPSNYHLTTNTSPVNLSANSPQCQYTFSGNWWDNSAASQIVADLLRETQISVSANTNTPFQSTLYQPWQYQEVIPPASKSPSASHKGVRTRGGFCRRKHPSECSRTQPNNPIPVQNSAICRARSFSSDFEDNNHNGVYSSKSKPYFNWQSSRTAWSAHDPAVLKKKPAAYLRASYSHGNVASVHLDCNTNVKPDKSQQLLIPHSNNNSSNPKVDSNNNTIRSSPDNRSEWNDTHTKINRCHHHNQQPPRRNRCFVSKSLSVCMDNTTHNTTTSSSSSSALKEDTSINVHIDEINKPKNQFVMSNWLLLPDELWLEILRYLSPVDRVRVAQTCRHLSRLSMDRSLWRVIHLHRQHHLTDADLMKIGNFKPKELRFTYCRGDSLTATGLKRMFLVCGPGLQKLSLIGCTKGPFDQDLPLRIVADHCHNLKHVNASYTQSVRDQTVIALAKSATHLISVKLNGAQQISNAAIQQLVHYHQSTLERLELFGCFRLNSSILALLGQCQELRALAFGHLHHLSSDGLLELVSKLPHLSSLDLRGTQTFSDDNNLTQLATKCPHLEEIVLANMHSLKCETGIAQMLRCLPRLRVLDLCGLVAVGDLTMEVLAANCPQLEELDVSCTSVTQKGLFHLTNAPAECLKCLRISHCKEITSDVLEKLIEACPKAAVDQSLWYMKLCGFHRYC